MKVFKRQLNYHNQHWVSAISLYCYEIYDTDNHDYSTFTFTYCTDTSILCVVSTILRLTGAYVSETKQCVL